MPHSSTEFAEQHRRFDTRKIIGNNFFERQPANKGSRETSRFFGGK
jgi:hypothetical protein